jgi:rhodanese-related sulfurtransferase
MEIREISPGAVAECCRTQTVDLIDVRTPVEFAEVHVVGARSVPLDELDPARVLGERRSRPDKPIYLICRSGSRGRKACEKFHAAGFTAVVNVAGGTQAWEQEGLPVERGRKAMSLERQVRIAAGSSVLLGVVFGWLVHPALLGIAAFVGGGLVFAGLTDTCGMGLLLARMPWNRTKASALVCSASSVSASLPLEKKLS